MIGATAQAPDPRAAPPRAAVRARGLCKTIDDKYILRDLNFEIPQGSFVALLGANGAGKTTLLNVLATLTTASSGELSLFDTVVKGDPARLRARIGLIGHGAMLYRDLSPMENLVFFGKLYDTPAPAQRAEQLLEYVQLFHRRHDPG